MLKAILFDLDGTLINSEQFYLDGWNEILAEVGANITFDGWACNYMGSTVDTNAQKLKDKYGLPGAVHELVARRQQRTIHRFKTTGVGLMPFVRETLEFCHARGLRLTVVTSSQRNIVDAIFERNGLGRYFECMITRSDVSNGKPDPESYLRCLEQLGVEKHECIAFEDTHTGVASAKAAGLVCYAIQSNEADHPKLTAADEIFHNLGEAKRFLGKRLKAKGKG